MKNSDATTQHLFSNTYNKFFNEVEKNWKSWHNNATLFLMHILIFKEEKKLKRLMQQLTVCNHATLILNENIDFFKEEEKSCPV